ncbi:probable C-terminal domain small phosphatase [Zea mays]|uniref:Mitochondrial import inner membrane translocase subunit TIM50 n=2 Tax=Zea mays TaxID=4577 RepID=A0A804MX19_MAIZE|nr:probable C-terminal domain small phosphatase [Zea mays]|eukprot:XP_008670998.1 probable C-terminal domain small phosphatase [Zea mays]
MTGHEVDDEPEARARMERRQVLTATAAAAEAGTLLGKSVAADARLSCPASSTAVEAGESSGVVVQAKGSATGLPSPLTKQMKKKLLILDLNGLLADINQDRHNAHLSHGTIRGKLVFKRPYCDDFLRFCMHHFELGIWSSRLRANVDAAVDILMEDDVKQRLLFCWDLSKCTGTGFYTLENKTKPLVLKELKKLWDDLPWRQQGEFSPSNTLLLDDSPYKALRNPPHTAIFPCPYSYKDDKDDALGPGGDLRLYLESLATTADDVQRYVRDHPFGQPPITEAHKHWEFYRRILRTTTQVE